MSHNNTKKRQKNTLRQVDLMTNLLMVVLTLFINVVVLYLIRNIMRFSSLSKSLFITIEIGVLILMLVFNFFILYAIRYRKKWSRNVAIGMLALLMVVSCFAVPMMQRLNATIDKITNTTKVEDVNASVVIYTKSDTLISSLDELKDKKIGYMVNTKATELAKPKLESLSLPIEFTEFKDYTELGNSLVAGLIDAAILPSNYQSIFNEDDTLSDYVDDFSSLETYSESKQYTTVSGSAKDLTKEPFTVLLIGDSDGLSDTIIIVSVNPATLDVTMTSIARDSYVSIPCYGGETKINAAHTVGVDCLIDTVENVSGVDIDYYMEVNFQGVVDVVEALGGIRLTNYVEFLGQTYTDEEGFHRVEMPIGENQLFNGEQALAFIRERKNFADGDFARQRHQQEFIKVVLHDVMQTRDVNTFLNLLDAAGDNISTNLTIDQITNFLKYALNKSKRYYDQDSIADIFNINGWRITGYSSMKYDAGLKMDLYIYRLWQTAIDDSKTKIDQNLELLEKDPIAYELAWSVNELYVTPPITQEYYQESKRVDQTKPIATPTPQASYATPQPTPVATVAPTPEAVQPESTPVVEEVVPQENTQPVQPVEETPQQAPVQEVPQEVTPSETSEEGQ